jgi:hypothetical protein
MSRSRNYTIAGVVAAYGVFRTQRWGVILTLVLMVVNVLISLPGIPFGPSAFDKVSSAFGFLVAAAAIYFLLRRDARLERKAELAA